MAQESGAEELTREVLPQGFSIIELPGHFFHMVGFRTPDDVAAYLDTLETVKGLSARMFVPAHAQAAEEIASLAQYNIGKVLEIGEKITALCPPDRDRK